ncbi:MAG: SDR family NAD(P)-dependent oxidoreductase [Bacteroidales bacterium]|nr:SDR family NAD(P)-dependent oxidoreductase [Bacteroidales bacterium]
MNTIDKKALITGASSGIGRAYAYEMAKRGYSLLIVSNEEEQLSKVCEEISSTYPVKIQSLYINLATVDAADKVFQYCQDIQWEIDVLINNAGIFLLDELVRLKERQIENILLLHILTTTKLCYLFGNLMKQRHHGFILNMSSLSAWMPYPGLNLYASSKIYLRSFSKALRQELKDYHVSVSTVCPGAIATDLYHLSHRLQNVAIHFGFMIRTEKFAHIAIKKMFRRKAMIMPGIVNHLMIPLCQLLPLNFVRFIMRKTKLLPYDVANTTSSSSPNTH